MRKLYKNDMCILKDIQLLHIHKIKLHFKLIKIYLEKVSENRIF